MTAYERAAALSAEAPERAALTFAAARVDDAVRIGAALDAAHAESTRRLYTHTWRVWDRWCAARGISALPADPAALAAYLVERAATGTAVASLNMARWNQALNNPALSVCALAAPTEPRFVPAPPRVTGCGEPDCGACPGTPGTWRGPNRCGAVPTLGSELVLRHRQAGRRSGPQGFRPAMVSAASR